MLRVVPSTLLAALMMSGAAIAPALSNDTLASGSSCSCTSGQGGSSFTGGGTGTSAVDPFNPNVVYVGGSTRYATLSTAGDWEKSQELRSGK